MCVTGEKQLKHMRDSRIYEKVWLITAKSIGETCNVLKFLRKREPNPLPEQSPIQRYFP